MKSCSPPTVCSPCVVGVLLAFCSLVALPLKYLASEGSGLQTFGEDASIMWVVHGWVFMVYVVVAFLLSRRASGRSRSRILALAAGLIPLLIFWVEHRSPSGSRPSTPSSSTSDDGVTMRP